MGTVRVGMARLWLGWWPLPADEDMAPERALGFVRRAGGRTVGGDCWAQAAPAPQEGGRERSALSSLASPSSFVLLLRSRRRHRRRRRPILRSPPPAPVAVAAAVAAAAAAAAVAAAAAATTTTGNRGRREPEGVHESRSAGSDIRGVVSRGRGGV